MLLQMLCNLMLENNVPYDYDGRNAQVFDQA